VFVRVRTRTYVMLFVRVRTERESIKECFLNGDFLLFDRKNEPIRMRTVHILERNNVATILVLLA
jgi:hypothetical protein